MRLISGIVTLVYLLAGVLIASNHHYFTNLSSLSSVVSAILAVVLWPLLLLGVDLHIGHAARAAGSAAMMSTLAVLRTGMPSA